METNTLFKGFVILLLLFIFYSLFSGLFYMIRDKGHSTRAVKYMTLRIAISIGLFILLFVGFATGLISPHGL